VTDAAQYQGKGRTLYAQGLRHALSVGDAFRASFRLRLRQSEGLGSQSEELRQSVGLRQSEGLRRQSEELRQLVGLRQLEALKRQSVGLRHSEGLRQSLGSVGDAFRLGPWQINKRKEKEKSVPSTADQTTVSCSFFSLDQQTSSPACPAAQPHRSS
jgi:hypothetical protein